MSTMTVFCLTALLAQVYLIKKNIYALGTFWKKEDQSQFVDSDPVDDVHLENIVKKDNIVPGEYNAQLRTYTLDDVSKHNVPDVGIWIVYKAGVYDITSFVQSHPGGDAVLLGAGNSVEPFWEVCSAFLSLKFSSLKKILSCFTDLSTTQDTTSLPDT